MNVFGVTCTAAGMLLATTTLADNLNITLVGEGVLSIPSSDLNCDKDCVLPIAEHSLVVLRANAAENWQFDGWQDNSCAPVEFGDFSAEETLLPKAANSFGAKSTLINDFNNDGLNDIVTNWLWSNRVDISFNNGDGFDTPVEMASGFDYPSAIHDTDWNDDGYIDILVTNYGDKNVIVYLNDGVGQFILTDSLTFSDSEGKTVSPYAVVVDDINGDDVPDILVASFSADTSGDLRVLENSITEAKLQWYVNQDGSYVADQLLIEQEGMITLDIADLDLDGDLDVLAASMSTYQSFVFHSVNGIYESSIIHKGNGLYGIASGDVNNDGLLDVISSSYWSGSVTLNLQMADGGFRPDFKIVQFNDGIAATAIGDLNADGQNDVVASIFNTSSFYQFENREYTDCHFYLNGDKDLVVQFSTDQNTVDNSGTEVTPEPDDKSSGGTISIYFALLVALIGRRNRVFN